MTELLENSDNTNADTGVSESPSNEAAISLAAVQALADALQKIESYTPTAWVDNESPDIDAAHLNKAEQAIMRVTTAMNSAVDVIKDLQSQVNTTNNNLSKCLQYIHSETDVFDFNDPKTPAGYHRLGAAASYKNAPSGLDGVNFCTVEVVRPTISDTLAMTIYPYKKGINPPVWYKSGGSNEWPTLPWNVYATKSDLTDIIMVKSFRGTSITVAGNASEKISIPISTPTGYKVVGKISEWWNNGPEMYLSQVDLTPTTFTGYAANLKNSEATSIPAISVLFVKS